MSFGATFVFKTLLYSVVILVKNIGVLMLFLELWRIGEDDPDLHDGFLHVFWSFGATFVFKTLLKKAVFGKCGKILLSGTCLSSKDPGGKKWF